MFKLRVQRISSHEASERNMPVIRIFMTHDSGSEMVVPLTPKQCSGLARACAYIAHAVPVPDEKTHGMVEVKVEAEPEIPDVRTEWVGHPSRDLCVHIGNAKFEVQEPHIQTLHDYLREPWQPKVKISDLMDISLTDKQQKALITCLANRIDDDLDEAWEEAEMEEAGEQLLIDPVQAEALAEVGQ